VQDKIEAMIKKLEFFSVCINKDNKQVFPLLYDFLCANELRFTDNVKCDLAKHLSELDAQLHRYFPETDDTNNWIRYPLSYSASSPLTHISTREPHQNCNKRFCENFI
jgi:hypothetical protein